MQTFLSTISSNLLFTPTEARRHVCTSFVSQILLKHDCSCAWGTRSQFNQLTNLRPELHRAPLVCLSPPLPSVRMPVSSLLLRSIVGVHVPVIVGVRVPVIVGVRMPVIMGVRVPVVHFLLMGDIGLCAPLARAVKHLGFWLVRVAVFFVGVRVAVVVVAVSMVAVRMAVSCR